MNFICSNKLFIKKITGLFFSNFLIKRLFERFIPGCFSKNSSAGKRCISVHWIHLGVSFGFCKFDLEIEDLCRLLLLLSAGSCWFISSLFTSCSTTPHNTHKLCDVRVTFDLWGLHFKPYSCVVVCMFSTCRCAVSSLYFWMVCW